MAAILPWISFFVATLALACSLLALRTLGFRPPTLTVKWHPPAGRGAEAGGGHAGWVESAPEIIIRVHEPPSEETSAPADRLVEDRPIGPILRWDPAEASAITGPKLIAVPNLAVTNAGEETASDELRRRFGTIWELADRQTAADEIARTSGYPIGQVELILGLRHLLMTGSASRSGRG